MSIFFRFIDVFSDDYGESLSIFIINFSLSTCNPCTYILLDKIFLMLLCSALKDGTWWLRNDRYWNIDHLYPTTATLDSFFYFRQQLKSIF